MIDPPRRIAAAVTGIGVVLCVLGWYQVSGQPTVPQQLPYLASATIPGAALLATGLVLLLRPPPPRPRPRPAERSAPAASTSSGPAATTPDEGPSSREGLPSAAGPSSSEALWRVPDGRYLHTAHCPLLDGRTDLIPAPDQPAAAPSETLRPCPLCRATADDPGVGSGSSTTRTRTHTRSADDRSTVDSPSPPPTAAANPGAAGPDTPDPSPTDGPESSGGPAPTDGPSR